MSFQPLVTIITPSYNHESYIDDYFSSLLNQTYDNIELIIFDDGSTDGTWDKLCSFEERAIRRFGRVVLERHSHRGPPKTTDATLQLAQGEFVCILDSDDTYLPNKIERNVEYLEKHPGMGAVHSDTHFIYEDHVEHNHWKRLGRKIPEGYIFDSLLESNFIMTCSFCCRSELIKKYVQFGRYASLEYLIGDYPMFLDLSKHSRIGYIDEALACYRVLSESLSHTSDSLRQFEFMRSFYKIAADYDAKFNLGESCGDRYLYRYYKYLFRQAYLLSLNDPCVEAYLWLRKKNPRKHATLPNRIRLISLRNNFVWRLVRATENNPFLRKVLRGNRRVDPPKAKTAP